MHAFLPARRHRASWWLAAILGSLALSLLTPVGSRADDNPNNYQCFGHISAGQPEAGNTDQQVAYKISCNGPITGYQLQTQVALTGFLNAPLITNLQSQPVTTDSFSCSGEFPGTAVNCVGSTIAGYETIAGQFSIAKKLCVEPRVDPRLTVTYAYLNEKKVVTQAISGPFDLGRPHGCASKKHKSKAKSGKKHKK